ncbi:MAG: DUF1501 domain-containing protein [Acidimicrobiales bacterium]|nr:DUF1501 domain-containing protein [Acidimicrobiales bacterium]
MTRLSRRRFLLGAGAAAAAGFGLDRYLESGGGSAAHAGSSHGGPLVLVTLYGGNDGLNTVVPYADSAYRAGRPTLGYSPGQVLDLSDGLGLNPMLKGLHGLWTQGRLAIVRGVGYPNPNLSHFASMDIWQTANPGDGSGSGWLGRWLDAARDDPMRAISIGATLPLALRGEKVSASAVTATAVTIPGGPSFQSAFRALWAGGADRVGLAEDVATSGQDLLDLEVGLGRLAVSGQTQGTDLAGQLAIVAALINAGASTQLYQVSLTGFDNHATEKATHERLLSELDSAIANFFQAVSAHPAGRQVMLMTYSEFGRRPAENASGGTDHGTAAPLFVVGQGVHGGRFYGEEPSLTDLDANGNLKYNIDFRSVYATVLERVLGADSTPVLGGRFPTLGFV